MPHSRRKELPTNREGHVPELLREKVQVEFSLDSRSVLDPEVNRSNRSCPHELNSELKIKESVTWTQTKADGGTRMK
jgi:hypothetical protein